MDTTILIIALCLFNILFIFFSAWLSSTETAITNLSNRQLAILSQKKVKNIHYLLQLKKRFSRTLITLLIANNVVNILLSSLTALVANKIFRTTGVSIAIGMVTFMLILFGEIVPKSRAILESVKISQKRARKLFYLNKFLTPIVLLFRLFSKWILRITGSKEHHQMPLISEESIISMTSLAEAEGIVKSVEKQIIENVFVFGDRKVSEVMIPMKSIFVVHLKDSIQKVRQSIYAKGFSRLPVIDENGLVQGILYAKDLSCPDMMMTIETIMRKPFFTGVDKEITALFEEMRNNHIHLSIVRNNKKRPVGIITMEDILEELVGEIEDEFDTSRSP